ncbi:MAG: CotH kinase family protein [Chlorobi bacterium]|nr:MAG: Inner spore coat protein H [Chlorobi bacterium OLB7]MBK8910962.1 CotH kinase family protein [Chlorobiota bacterium]
MKHRMIVTFALLATMAAATSQPLPMEMRRTADGRMLLTGDQPNGGLYDQSLIRTVRLTFAQPNYWQLLQQNYQAEIEIPATMEVDGITYDSVGIRFRGQTSYRQIQQSQKKSFNVSIDFVHDKQRLMGYKTLNLLNCFDDPSFMREVFFQHQIKRHIPAAKSAYIHLYINGEDWGLYPNVQQLNKDFYEEWFLSNDGTNWRADVPDTLSGVPGMGGGGKWGDGTAGLNYLGADTALYQKYYTLKSTDRDTPWDDLVRTCQVLNQTPVASLPDALPAVMDVDRALWFMASELLFSDDDGYVNKGKMDYYLYWEAETGRITPIEYDANSVMKRANQNWSPFYHETNVNYPLLNRVLAVPQYRQRYLAHMRTLIAELMDTATAFAALDRYHTMIDSIVQKDSKKLYPYQRFATERDSLKNFIRQRRNYLLSNAEVAQTAPAIAGVEYVAGKEAWVAPAADQAAVVKASATHQQGVKGMNLYFATGIVGNFTKVEMADDGQHGDGAANDGTYAAEIPGQAAGTWVRFYVEAVANNSASSVSYAPPGAEHDVYTYTVAAETAAGATVVINEFMASNSATVVDNAEEYEDWIELYNTASEPVNLAGYHITDDPTKMDKWTFPEGAVIPANGYFILWADEDDEQGANHCNFKLSASAEQLLLSDASMAIIDSVSWGQQTADMSFARKPNGTGNFAIQAPTFNSTNDAPTTGVSQENQTTGLRAFPNPANEWLRIILNNRGNSVGTERVVITNTIGVQMFNGVITAGIDLDISSWAAGVYFVQSGTQNMKIVVE